MIERENKYLKDENQNLKLKSKSQAQTLKDFSASYSNLEKEKILADKVTNELLQRIQRYEQEMSEL